MSRIIIILCCLYLTVSNTFAIIISATPDNYTVLVANLVAGDTMHLAAGDYVKNLTLKNISGTETNPIVIMGSGTETRFLAQSCCNTVSLTKCAYLVLSNFVIEGQNLEVDAIKAEGTAGNWAHHITIEKLNITGYGNNQQIVGISTKCPAWNWIIRKNRIVGAGTGLYLGNSDGTKPFVNGLIEFNFVANTIGYNIEVKHQINSQRDSIVGIAINGKTIIRNNVFSKDTNSSTGGSARPNLLVGGMPSIGWGSQDYYEIYNNFFFNNPTEALFQGTGNIYFYNNILVNHYDASGLRAVYITPQNGISPQDIKVFHNTIWAKNSSGGIRIYNADKKYKQYCYSNAVFAPNAISNFTNAMDNVTDTYEKASEYLLSADIDLSKLNLYPQSNKLNSTISDTSLFVNVSNASKDFNNGIFDWTNRGAYSGCCVNNGWKLQLDTMPDYTKVVNSIEELEKVNSISVIITNGIIELNLKSNCQANLFDYLGNFISSQDMQIGENNINISALHNGVYYLQLLNSIDKNILKILKK